jgi:dihydroorotate dehydrogenase
MYKSILKPIFFIFPPETIHHVVFSAVKFFFKIPGLKWLVKKEFAVDDKKLNRTVFGIDFPNPVGLAAGLDKNASHVDELSCFGFGFVEIGTVTPLAQPGNPKPRMFRLIKDEAIINRMGFNNDGAKLAGQRLRKRKSNVIIGGNIGKNKDTPNELAIGDYEKCFRELYDAVDYFVVNVSSPNTPGLRELQEKEPLKKILLRLQELNRELRNTKPKPILLKIAPDLSNHQLDDIVEIIRETKLDGVVATNTTIARPKLLTPDDHVQRIGSGGLSGKPLSVRSTEVIRYLHTKSEGKFDIIGVGGIHSSEDAIEKLNAGAALIQIYTCFVYEGPSLVKKINRALKYPES